MFDVLHIITTIERGGAENAIKILSQEQVRQGKKIAILPLKGKPELLEELSQSGVFVDLSLLNSNFIYQVLKVKSLVNKCKVIHCHLPRAEVLGKLSLAKNRMVITRHNTESFLPTAPKWISSFLSRQITKGINCVVAISNSVKMFLIENQEIRESNQIRVIYYGYRQSNNLELTNKVDSSVSTNTKKIRFGSLSRLATQKNIPLMIDFATELLNSGTNFSIDIAGEGPQRELINNLIEKRGLERHVFLVGRIPNVMEFLFSLDYFILTSHYEGFGMALLEAINAGLPILAPNNSSIPEVLGTKHIGLFESGNSGDLVRAFLGISHSSEIRKDLIAYQFERLKLFSIENYYFKHEAVYEEFSS